MSTIFSKNQMLSVVITDFNNDGEGVGKVDGFTFFIKDAMIGDKAIIRVTKVKKNYGYGRLEKIIEASPDRIEPHCPVSRQCGGCQIQSMSYTAQLKFKENKVKNNLLRIGGFDNDFIDKFTEPIIGMDSDSELRGFGYRNKAQFPFGKNRDGDTVCGFYAGRTHSIIANTDCVLGVSENKEILELILEWMKECRIKPYNEEDKSGLVRHVLIRKGYYTGEIMVCMVINSDSLPNSEKLIDKLIKVKGMKSISFSPNKKDTNVIMGDSYNVIWGSAVIKDILLGLEYNISPLSFYQVNPVQVEKLYGTAIEYAALTGEEEVWDLCCGIGTITLSMASKAKKVHGIEIVPQAIEDAMENAKNNGIKNAEFICAAVEEYLPEHKSEINSDVIVMDPPRKGMDEKALSVVVEASPKRIVYVSCDSATLARDLKYLCENGYSIEKVRPVDMFPQTIHVESVVLITRKDK